PDADPAALAVVEAAEQVLEVAVVPAGQAGRAIPGAVARAGVPSVADRRRRGGAVVAGVCVGWGGRALVAVLRGPGPACVPAAARAREPPPPQKVMAGKAPVGLRARS